MPRVFGNKGSHGRRHSARAFKRMLLLAIPVAALAGFVQGIALTTLASNHGQLTGLAGLIVGVALFLWWLFNSAAKQISAFERENHGPRKHARGEWKVETELQRLSEKFVVFHDVLTPRGHFDHLVIGPTGFFALKTENWHGSVAANQEGELTRNAEELEEPIVRKFMRRVMMLHDQVSDCLEREDFFIRGVMVFPSAHVDVAYGTTQKIHCLHVENLRDYLLRPHYSRKLSQRDVENFVRALKEIAGLETAVAPAPASLQPAIT